MIGEEEEIGMVERRKIEYVGNVEVQVMIEREKKMMEENEIVELGMNEEERKGEMMEEIMMDEEIEEIERIKRVRRKDIEKVREYVRREVRDEENEEWGKKKVVKVLVNRIR